MALEGYRCLAFNFYSFRSINVLVLAVKVVLLRCSGCQSCTFKTSNVLILKVYIDKLTYPV